MRHFTEYPPLTLYIHFPWCVKKCPYCDFNSHAVKDDIPESQYIDSLIADLEQHAPDIWSRSVESVFIGGGTPSLISSEGIDRLMGQVRALTKLEPRAEITLEANPGTVEQQRFSEYRVNINRLSIGIQSFNDKHLHSLGRIHGAEEAIAACETAITAGFDNFNIDLMHGLPNQTVDEAIDDVAQAISLKPAHLSYYQLTLEPNTLFAANPPTLPDEQTLDKIQELGKARIFDAGFKQYEVSAYARDDQRCQHNLNYWLFGDYLGIGAGAHSKLSFPAHNSIVRHSKARHPADYIKTASTPDRIRGEIQVSEIEARLEFMMNALRLNGGFSVQEFEGRTGESIASVRRLVDQAQQDGLIERDLQQIKTTDLGARHLDTLLQRFMPEVLSENTKPGLTDTVIPIIGL